ncbi:MAG: ParB/RepB/Spo0J family partition protein [Candidatus Peregrinibacteria bacterium]|nr:ParB/RepB/Spo0J family partition protein [Candidatus Peregrinibacteria bacterium]
MALFENPAKDIPGLDAIPQENILTWDIIEQTDITQHGDVAPAGLGRFVRMPQLELKTWFLAAKDLDLIYANPDQPREFFEPGKMEALQTSIYEKGQKEAIKISPCMTDDGLVQFIIIDGERRLRNLKEMAAPYIKFEIEFSADERQLFETSYLYNDARAEHTPMENARSFQRMVGWAVEKDGLPKEQAIAAVAKKLTKSVAFVRNHLKLLTFSAEVQEMVGQGMPISSAITLGSAEKKFGANTSALRVARMILQDPDRDLPVATKGVNVGHVTQRGIKDLLTSELVHGGTLSPEDGRKLKAAQAVLGFASALHSVRVAATRVLDPTMKAAMVETLRSRRGNPPEVLYEELDETVKLLKAFYADLLKDALEAPKIEVPKDAPKFRELLDQGKDKVKNEVRWQMLQILLQESEGDGRFITADYIQRKLAELNIQVDGVMVGNNLRTLNIELPAGVIIDTMEVRQRSKVTQDLKKTTGYRLDYRKGHYDPVTPAKR